MDIQVTTPASPVRPPRAGYIRLINEGDRLGFLKPDGSKVFPDDFPIMPLIADADAGSVVAKFNTLLSELKTAGLMASA